MLCLSHGFSPQCLLPSKGPPVSAVSTATDRLQGELLEAPRAVFSVSRLRVLSLFFRCFRGQLTTGLSPRDGEVDFHCPVDASAIPDDDWQLQTTSGAY